MYKRYYLQVTPSLCRIQPYTRSSYTRSPLFANRIPLLSPRLFHSRSPSLSPASPHTCWHCKEILPRSTLFCSKGKIQPTFVDSTYHDVLLPDTPAEAVPYTFDVDPKTLRNRFLALQSRVHPDGFATASQTERVCAEQQSSFINKGYQALRDPLPRATYLLSLHGLDPKDHDGNDPTATDPALLMDVMEAREALEEAETEEDIKGIKAENEERLNATLRALSDAFRARDIPAARRLTIQLRYWVNIRQAATDWMPGKRVELEH